MIKKKIITIRPLRQVQLMDEYMVNKYKKDTIENLNSIFIKESTNYTETTYRLIYNLTLHRHIDVVQTLYNEIIDEYCHNKYYKNDIEILDDKNHIEQSCFIYPIRLRQLEIFDNEKFMNKINDIRNHKHFLLFLFGRKEDCLVAMLPMDIIKFIYELF